MCLYEEPKYERQFLKIVVLGEELREEDRTSFAFFKDIPEHLSGSLVDTMASHSTNISDEVNDW